MAYDDKLAERVRKVLAVRPDVVEKKMFGGIAFMLGGKMFIGVANRDLMVRVGPDAYEEALQRAHARPMDFTGRPMTGYVFVGPGGWRTDAMVAAWADQAATFVAKLPAAKRKPRPRPRIKRRVAARRRA